MGNKRIYKNFSNENKQSYFLKHGILVTEDNSKELFDFFLSRLNRDFLSFSVDYFSEYDFSWKFTSRRTPKRFKCTLEEAYPYLEEDLKMAFKMRLVLSKKFLNQYIKGKQKISVNILDMDKEMKSIFRKKDDAYYPILIDSVYTRKLSGLFKHLRLLDNLEKSKILDKYQLIS